MVGDEKNRPVGIELAANSNAYSDETAHEFVISVREGFRLLEPELQEPILNEHQWKGYGNKGGEKHRAP